jgi:DNA-binding HxlR family transcriptional regulator
VSVRTYGQHCGLAAAMDLVGQRWSMLIVRELTPGPRRFTDLNAALPGVATDVLAERLRELVGAGVVEHRSLRHPVPVKVYALTPSGHALADVALRLADWGRSLLPVTPAEGTLVRARWALQTMAFAYRGGLADGDYEVVVDDEELTLRIAGPSATVHYGPSPGGPLVRLTCSTRQFFTAVRDPSWLRRPHRGVAVDGDAEVAVALFTALPLPVGAEKPAAR